MAGQELNFSQKKKIKLQSNAEQPSTKWTGNCQKDIPLQKTKGRPHTRGRRSDYMISTTPYLPGGKPHRLKTNWFTDTHLQE